MAFRSVAPHALLPPFCDSAILFRFNILERMVPAPA